jgi:hypothetical protein
VVIVKPVTDVAAALLTSVKSVPSVVVKPVPEAVRPVSGVVPDTNLRLYDLFLAKPVRLNVNEVVVPDVNVRAIAARTTGAAGGAAGVWSPRIIFMY